MRHDSYTNRIMLIIRIRVSRDITRSFQESVMQWPSRLVEGIGIRVIFMKRCPLAGRTKEPAAN